MLWGGVGLFWEPLKAYVYGKLSNFDVLSPKTFQIDVKHLV